MTSTVPRMNAPKRLIAAEGDRLPAVIWDPCCGNGDISVVLEQSGRKVVSTDLVDRGMAGAVSR
jgi:hypothetical protein